MPEINGLSFGARHQFPRRDADAVPKFNHLEIGAWHRFGEAGSTLLVATPVAHESEGGDDDDGVTITGWFDLIEGKREERPDTMIGTIRISRRGAVKTRQ